MVNARPSIPLTAIPARLLDMMGGFTQQVRNPDSWEGWYWGSKHVWGQGFQGMMSPAANLIKDITENSDMVLFWGCDPETTPWGFTGQYATRILLFLEPGRHQTGLYLPGRQLRQLLSMPINGSRSCPIPMPLCSWP